MIYYKKRRGGESSALLDTLFLSYLFTAGVWEKLQEFFQNNYWIYQWKCKTEICNDFYIGHTNNYEKRKQEHIKSCINSKTKNHHCKIYQCIRANGGIDNWEMVILEQFCAKNRKEAEQKEQEYIDKMNPSLNMCKAQKV